MHADHWVNVRQSESSFPLKAPLRLALDNKSDDSTALHNIKHVGNAAQSVVE